MEKKKKIHFGLLFAVLAGFTLVSMGLISTSVLPVKASADDVFISCKDDAFDMKVLRFLRTEKICALDKDQVRKVTQRVETQLKVFEVEGQDVNVLYLKGKPLNKQMIEDIIGEELDKKCQVVHGNMIVAILSPMFVS